MGRTFRWGLFGCAVLLVAGEASVLRAEENARGQELRRLLEQPVKFPGFDDPKTTFSEALEALAKRYNLAFDINEEAFKDAARKEAQKEKSPKKVQLEEVSKIEIATPNPVPEMHTKLGTVLKKMLSRVSPSTTYFIREDVIEITTLDALRKEFYRNRPGERLPPLVSATFDKVPLEAALKELAGSGNIVLDSRNAKEAATPVTADLANVPLDTAVQMLADMAGLKVVPMDNSLYVTSKDNARALIDEQEKLTLQRRQEKQTNTDKPTDKPEAQPDPTKAKAASGGK